MYVAQTIKSEEKVKLLDQELIEFIKSKYEVHVRMSLRTLSASFKSSNSLFFSSSTSGFAVPCFSSLILSMYSNI